MNSSSLVRKAAVAEWETEFMRDGVPFGRIQHKWAVMLEKMEPGDEIWLWSSGPESWELQMGTEGLALIRDGQHVDSFITSLN